MAARGKEQILKKKQLDLKINTRISKSKVSFLEINGYFAVGHFRHSKNKIPVIVEEIVAESEDKLLLPQRR